MKKKILSIILVLAMLACMIPMGMVTVSAGSGSEHSLFSLYFFPAKADSSPSAANVSNYTAYIIEYAAEGADVSAKGADTLAYVMKNGETGIQSQAKSTVNISKLEWESGYGEYGFANLGTTTDWCSPLRITTEPDDTYAVIFYHVNGEVSELCVVGEDPDDNDNPGASLDFDTDSNYNEGYISGWQTYTAPASPTLETWGALQDAINAAPGDATIPATKTTTIQLTQDLTAPDGADSITIPEGKDITIDLNGKVLNANGECRVITVNAGGKLAVIDSLPATEHKGYIDANGLWQLGEPKNGETVKNLTGGVITGGLAPVVEITGDTYSYSGGVYNKGTFAMYGGNIAGNTHEQAYAVYGGGVYNEGTFTMYNGSIVGNVISATSDNEYGGGVCNYGTFTMKNGTIDGNTACMGGGVFISIKCTFTMEDGKISGNTAKLSGGGVYNISLGNATFKMQGGEISGNTAEEYGGGIYTSRKTAKVYLTADAGKTISITGNKAGIAEGGVRSLGELHLSGKVIIKDNICENTYGSINYPENLAIVTSGLIKIDGALTGSDIHVTHANDDYPDKHDFGVLTSGYATYSDKVFTYDGPYAMIVNENSELEVNFEKKLASGVCDSFDGEGGMMARQGLKLEDNSASPTIGRTIIPITKEQLNTIKNKIVVVATDGSQAFEVDVDCAYTYFYNWNEEKGEAEKINAEDMDYAAFLIIDNNGKDGTITGFGYYRLYLDSIDNFMFDAMYQNPNI